jgi:hypothetical protein
LDQAQTVVSSGPSIVPELVEKGILIRGVLLKCERCRQEAWYGLSELTETFICRRCYRSQTVIGGQLVGSPEPVWTYRLAEVVRMFLANEGDLPLLVAWDRFGETRMPLAVAHELKISRPNGDDAREIDIALAHGYELWIGEATTSGSIQPLNRINKLKQLAGWLPAYGVILATSRPHFTRSVRERFEHRFSSVWPERALLTGVKRGP